MLSGSRDSIKIETSSSLSMFGICSSILIATNNRDIEFGESAAGLFSKSEDILTACFFSLRTEIQQTTTEELLFRTDSFCTRFLTATLRQMGTKFLKTTLVPIFKAIDTSPPIETDPLRLDDPADQKQNTLNLVSVCSSLLKKLTTSLQKINPIIAHILLEVYNQVHDIYPRAATKSLGAILFLRFIFPAFTQPVKYKLLSSCSPALARKLVIVAKILQCIFNEAVRREDEWIVFAPFVLKNIETNKLVYDSLLVAVQASKVSRKHFSIVPKADYFTALRIYQELCKNNLQVCESFLSDNSVIHEMLLAIHRQSLIMGSAVPTKEIVQIQGKKFISWLQSSLCGANKSLSVPVLRKVVRRSSFVDVPIPQELLENMCQYVIQQQPSAELFLKTIRSTMLPDTLFFLDVAVNEFDTLSLSKFSLKVIIQALNKYLLTQPLLRDFPVPGSRKNSQESKQKHVETIFTAIMQTETENIFRMSSLFTLFENVIVCSDNNPPFSSLAKVLLPMLYTIKANEEYEDIISALEVLLHNIGSVLNILPRNPQLHTVFEPPPPLDQRDWQFLFINSRTTTFSSKEIVLQQGEKNCDLCLIQSGSVEVFFGETLIATLNSGEFFGDISFLSQLPTQCKIIAADECIIQRMPSNFVLRVLECDNNLFERFYFMIAKFTAERLVRKTNGFLSSSGGVVSLFTSTKKAEIVPIEIYFSDGTSQWFECNTLQTIKSLRDHISNTIERGQTLCDVAYSRLYESCINPISNERQFSVMEDTWTVDAIFTRAKYASRHAIYFLLEDPTVTHTEFSLSTAFIINEFPCKAKHSKGTLYIIPKHMVFYAQNHKLKKKEKSELFLRVSEYKEMCLDGCKLVIVAKSNKQIQTEKFRFVNNRDALLAYQTLKSLHPQLKSGIEHLESPLDEDNHAIVIKDFTASTPEEMSVSVCQIVNVISHTTDHCKVENSESTQRGTVPVSNLKFLAWTPNSLDTTSRLVEHHLSAYEDGNGIHLPSRREWLKILAGGKLLVFKPGEVILRRGSTLQRMYQVVQGNCQVREADAYCNVITELHEGEIFGEISLLLGASTATIVTAADDSSDENEKEKKCLANTIVLVIEAEFLQRLFSTDKTLAGKFYKYVACVTQRRLLDRSVVVDNK